jgi:formylglycine-generating enzyme required for sulfatase activity
MGYEGPSPLAHQDRVDGPVHTVTIAKPYALGRFEVTFAEFSAFVRDTGHTPPSDCMSWQTNAVKPQPGKNWQDPGYPTKPEARHPVVCVSWVDAKAYVAWLSKKTGKLYRLPSEAEWEYAAAAGARTVYPWGDSVDGACKYANVYDADSRGLRPWGELACTDPYRYLAPVGSFAPNAFGVYDMVGNVYEWGEDCWVQPYGVQKNDGSAHQVPGECRDRTVRGSAWHSPASYLRPTFRGRDLIHIVSQIFGLRVARDVD